MDWLSLVFTALVVFAVFYWTLAPDVTLQDSGEMATASLYAGIPHSPGYPLWTLYTWLWTHVPFGTIAWRVELGNAFAGALAGGLLALIVSRSSSMIIESIEAFKDISRRWENAICFVAGFAAGGLSCFDSYFWSMAVVVDKHTLSIASLCGLLVFLLRWVYAPHQHRYLFASFYMYGICFTNHQSLLPIIMGMQVLIWLVEPKIGREFFFGNTVIFLVVKYFIKPGLLLHNPTVLGVFNVVGYGSALLWIWLVIKTKKPAIEFARDLVLLAFLGCLGALFLGETDYLPSFNSTSRLFLVFIITIPVCGLFIYLVKKTWRRSKEWFQVLLCGFLWIVGSCFYLYEVVGCMTDPPMEWAYPRTVQGFIHAITRGQYSPINPTSGHGNNVVQIVSSFFATYGMQLWRYLEGTAKQFDLFFLLLIGLIFLVYRQLKRRERVWLLGLTAMYTCMGPFLVLLLNFAPTRESIAISAPLFALGHVFIAMFVAYGLAIGGAFLATKYESARPWLLVAGVCALDFMVYTLVWNCQTLIGNLDDEIASQYGFWKVVCWILAIVTMVILWKNRMQKDRLLFFGLPGMFVLCSLGLTLATIFSDRKGKGGFGYLFHNIIQAFAPYQYGVPVYAALILLAMALLYFVGVWFFRQRAALVIALLAFSTFPVYSVMIHWSSSEQRDHYFGYWFGHDMFTPPFGIYPKMARNAILFGGTDPGRFVPTYMIFCESFTPDNDKPRFDPTFNRRDVYIITQNALADSTYLQYLRAQYFPSHEHDPPFFQQVLRGPQARKENYTTNLLARIAYDLLDQPLETRGARIEARWRKEGVYPPKQIYIPSDQDLQNCFAEYTQNVERRAQLHELEPGEVVTPVTNANGQVSVQVSGEVAVMKINGLLCKVIFDHNPTNKFYVEESFPLNWMYPYETPYGIIEKLHRHVVPTFSPEVFKKDHEFWSKYSARFIGNWITYKTTVKQIAAFAERVYLHRDYKGFTGSRRFVRDVNAQQSFSKERSSIAGLYAWRLGALQAVPTPPKYLARNPVERQELIREADFAFKQAFAFCPYSPEVVYRFVTLLVDLNRLNDAITVAQTCSDFDPYNTQIANLVKQLKRMKKGSAGRLKFEAQLQHMESEAQTDPTNFHNIFQLASLYYQLHQTDRVVALLDHALANPHIPPQDISAIADFYAHIGNLPKLDDALERLTTVAPNEPLPWYNLAALNVLMGKTNEALQDLRTSLNLNAKRLKQNPKMTNLLEALRKDPRFNPIRNLPAFQKLISSG